MDNFSIEINYGGHFVRKGRMEYADGKHENVDKCDVDRMSIIEVHDILTEIGVTEWKTLQYCDPRYGLKKGLKSLESDADVLQMVNKLDKKKFIKIYVEPKDVCASQEDTFENALIPLEVEGERGEEMHVDFEVYSVSASLNDDISSHADSENNSEEGEESSTKWAEYTSNSTDVEIGMKFASLQDIKKVVQENAMNDGHNVKFVKNEARRLTAICVDGCKWRLHASRMQNEASFQIKTYHNVHTCAQSMESRHASAKWVATKYVERFKSQPDWPIQSIFETVRRDYSINITAILSYRARKIARDMNDGCGNEQYKQLWSYAKEIRKTNPGSTFKICVDQVTKESNTIFRRAYMCFEACKQGILDGGRPVICLDRCHLKGQCPGHLLSAVGIDGNDGIYPIAVAVVESECSDSWQWFLEILLHDLRIVNGSGWTFISDQQKGLVTTFTELVPQAEVRYCVRHMYANFKSKFRGKVYKDVMMSASRATTKYDFDKEMDKLRSFDTAAHTYLQSHDPRTWAKHLFSHVPKCDISLNNLSESFNALLLPARDKPILTMLETIRKIVMSRIAKKYKTMEEHADELCPKVKKKLRSLMNASRNWSPLHGE